MVSRAFLALAFCRWKPGSLAVPAVFQQHYSSFGFPVFQQDTSLSVSQDVEAYRRFSWRVFWEPEPQTVILTSQQDSNSLQQLICRLDFDLLLFLGKTRICRYVSFINPIYLRLLQGSSFFSCPDDDGFRHRPPPPLFYWPMVFWGLPEQTRRGDTFNKTSPWPLKSQSCSPTTQASRRRYQVEKILSDDFTQISEQTDNLTTNNGTERKCMTIVTLYIGNESNTKQTVRIAKRHRRGSELSVQYTSPGSSRAMPKIFWHQTVKRTAGNKK